MVERVSRILFFLVASVSMGIYCACFYSSQISFAQELSFSDAVNSSNAVSYPNATCDPIADFSCTPSSTPPPPAPPSIAQDQQQQDSFVAPDQPLSSANDSFAIDQQQQQFQQEEQQQQQLQQPEQTQPSQQTGFIEQVPLQQEQDSFVAPDQPLSSANDSFAIDQQQQQQFQQEQQRQQLQQPEQTQPSQQTGFIEQETLLQQQQQQQQDQFFGANQSGTSNQGLFGAPAPMAPSNINLKDTDGDDLLDVWETTGMDLNNNGVIELDLKKRGANPLHKDLFVEVDFMQFHKPFDQTIKNLVKSFANAPVRNPNATDGITLHVELDEQIPHRTNTTNNDLIKFKQSNFGTVAERRDKAAITAKSIVYHYALFAHNQPGIPSSGLSNGRTSMEFMLTLAGRNTFFVNGHSVGTVDEQDGTFMHELGHNLGLKHGGTDEINCKPNYLSVMTHDRQQTNFLSTRPLDYSRSVLSTLNESKLDEKAGVSQSTPPGLDTIHGPPTLKISKTGVPLDWDRNNVIDNKLVPADINFIDGSANFLPIPNCGPSPKQTLTGFNDWPNLKFSQAAKDLISKLPKPIPNPIRNPVVNPVPNPVVNISSIIQDTFGVDITNASSAALASNKILEVSEADRTLPEDMPPELTMEDVKNSRPVHLNMLNELIDSLPDSAFRSGGTPNPPTPTTSCDPASPLLELDSRGDKVVELQTHLTALGYGELLGPPGIDGIFGPFTDVAVRQYQTDHQLLVDGKVGPETWGSICSSINSQQQQQIPVGQTGGPRTILLGMTDPETSELSRLLLSDQLDESVNQLLQLRSLSDGSVGGDAENDLIVSPEAQLEFLSILDNAILAFEKQGPGYDEQGNFKSSLPLNSIIFAGQEQSSGPIEQGFTN